MIQGAPSGGVPISPRRSNPIPTPLPASRPRRARQRGPAADIELEIAGVVVRIGSDASEAVILAVVRALKASG